MTRYARVRRSFGVLLALTIGAGGAGYAQGGDAPPQPITLSAAEQARLGVQTQVLIAVPAPQGLATTARVLDPGPLIQLDADLAAASASLAASRAEAGRTRKLYAQDRTASARALEMADAQAQADLQRVNGAHRRLLLEWGDAVARLPARRRGSAPADARGAGRAQRLAGAARGRADAQRAAARFSLGGSRSGVAARRTAAQGLAGVGVRADGANHFGAPRGQGLPAAHRGVVRPGRFCAG
jgi:hypothetical protein